MRKLRHEIAKVLKDLRWIMAPGQLVYVHATHLAGLVAGQLASGRHAAIELRNRASEPAGLQDRADLQKRKNRRGRLSPLRNRWSSHTAVAGRYGRILSATSDQAPGTATVQAMHTLAQAEQHFFVWRDKSGIAQIKTLFNGTCTRNTPFRGTPPITLDYCNNLRCLYRRP